MSVTTIRQGARDAARGYTLVELAVVVVIVGVLAAFAVPRFNAAVEESRATEAVHWSAELRRLQDLFHARQGTYTVDITELEGDLGPLEFFTAGAITVPASEPDLQSGWTITLTRSAAGPGTGVGSWGAYTVTWTHSGYDEANSTLPDRINPMPTD